MTPPGPVTVFFDNFTTDQGWVRNASGTDTATTDIDGGLTSIRSPVLTLPPTGTLTLTFSYYFAHGSNSSTADFLRVTVIGSTSTQVFQELGSTTDDDAVCGPMHRPTSALSAGRRSVS